MTTEIIQSSGAVWKSRWPSRAPVPDKPTVSVDIKQHSTNNYQSKSQCRKLTLENKTPPLFLEQTEPTTFWPHAWCAATDLPLWPTTDLSLLPNISSVVLGRQVLHTPFFITPHRKYHSHPCQTLCGWQDIEVQLLIHCHGEPLGSMPVFSWWSFRLQWPVLSRLHVMGQLFFLSTVTWVANHFSFCLLWPFFWRKMAVYMLWVSWSFCPVTFAANQLVFLPTHLYCPQWPLQQISWSFRLKWVQRDLFKMSLLWPVMRSNGYTKTIPIEQENALNLYRGPPPPPNWEF